MKKETKINFSVVGGIGDILLSFAGIEKAIKEFGKDNIHLYILSHFRDAEKLLEQYDVQKTFVKFTNNDQLVKILENLGKLDNFFGDVKLLEHSYYPNIVIDPKYDDIAENIVVKACKKLLLENDSINIIGIHPFGSEFANNFLVDTAKRPSKNIPAEVIITVIKEIEKRAPSKNAYIIFGSEKERAYFDILEYNFKKTDIVLIPSFNNPIWVSFALADYCDFLICADSAIKSYALIKNRKSIVLLGNYADQTRDSYFIDPYKNDGILIPIRYNSTAELMEGKHNAEIIESALKIIHEI